MWKKFNSKYICFLENMIDEVNCNVKFYRIFDLYKIFE